MWKSGLSTQRKRKSEPSFMRDETIRSDRTLADIYNRRKLWRKKEAAKFDYAYKEVGLV